MTHRKGISNLKRHRTLGVSQPAAGYLLQRIRKAFENRDDDHGPFNGPVEVDESCFGGKRANMSNAKRKAQTDAAAAYRGLPDLGYRHERVRHAAGEYGKGTVHTNGLESFRSMRKRGCIGVCHKMSPKHPGRHVAEFSGRHNHRRADTRRQMARVVEGMAGKQMRYRILIADNGLPSGAWS